MVSRGWSSMPMAFGTKLCYIPLTQGNFVAQYQAQTGWVGGLPSSSKKGAHTHSFWTLFSPDYGTKPKQLSCCGAKIGQKCDGWCMSIDWESCGLALLLLVNKCWPLWLTLCHSFGCLFQFRRVTDFPAKRMSKESDYSSCLWHCVAKKRSAEVVLIIPLLSEQTSKTAGYSYSVPFWTRRYEELLSQPPTVIHANGCFLLSVSEYFHSLWSSLAAGVSRKSKTLDQYWWAAHICVLHFSISSEGNMVTISNADVLASTYWTIISSSFVVCQLTWLHPLQIWLVACDGGWTPRGQWWPHCLAHHAYASAKGKGCSCSIHQGTNSALHQILQGYKAPNYSTGRWALESPWLTYTEILVWQARLCWVWIVSKQEGMSSPEFACCLWTQLISWSSISINRAGSSLAVQFAFRCIWALTGFSVNAADCVSLGWTLRQTLVL